MVFTVSKGRKAMYTKQSPLFPGVEHYTHDTVFTVFRRTVAVYVIMFIVSGWT